MAAKWIEFVTGSLEQKKQWREAQRRIDALPAPYQDAAKAAQRYLMYTSGVVDGETSVQMVVDLADLWERAATDGVPVRDIVGADPVEFAEEFARAYTGKNWIDKERKRLNDAMDAAEKEQS